MNEKHTAGAIKAAEIILNGKPDIMTAYGRKRIDGIADLIGRETHARDMLNALNVCLRRLECVEEPGHGLSIRDSIREIITTAEGGTKG